MRYIRLLKTAVLPVLLAFCLVCLAVLEAFAIDVPAAANAGKEGGPEVQAQAAYVYCENTGEVVYSRSSGKRFSPYGLSKLMASLVAVRKVPMDRKVKVSEEAASRSGEPLKLQKGEELTMEQMLYGMLLANDDGAAYAIAEAVKKSPGKFVKKMNKMAKNLGCTETHFSDPAGLKNAKTYTTARDQMNIFRVAMSDESLRKIAGTKKYVIPRTNKSGKRIIESTVPLLGEELTGICAGKSGAGPSTDDTVAVEYHRNGLRLFVVLLADKTLALSSDIRNLTKDAEESIPGILVVKAGKKVGDVRIGHGAKTSLPAYTKDNGYAYLPKEGSESLIRSEYKPDIVKAPVKAGEQVGEVQITVGGEVVNTVPVVVKESVETGWFPSYIGISNFVAGIIGAVLLVLLAFALVILILRFRAKRRRVRQHRERIRQEALRRLQEEEDHRKRNWDL